MKRLIDIVGAVIGLSILFPLIGVTAALIYWRLGRPVLFLQLRPGLDGIPFKLIKFRTMVEAGTEEGRLLSDAERLTPLGRFLRSTSLDELPELWNVLRGDMSLVGPRPLLMEYLQHYDENQARRHQVRPGLTGWAQINGRNTLSWDDKFALDTWYVDHQSMALDVQILWKTIFKVLQREGIHSDGEATMSKFEGSARE
ncbi:MAG TPA: sugar transferase [Erythrobacter sp.]|nr:sugar transferase [Sphingomonadaceae bacterium]MBB12000.1 sugar transferase [Sphingomonadaceae bacterium]HAW35440.1 sugar transferase [Erythrobacter sp.]